MWPSNSGNGAGWFSIDMIGWIFSCREYFVNPTCGYHDSIPFTRINVYMGFVTRGNF